jgi:hypothetical protein
MLIESLKQVGDLLSDERRINVAITRARSKLILIGSADTLRGNKLLGSLVDHACKHGTVISLSDKGLVEGCPAWAAKDAWAVFRKVHAQKASFLQQVKVLEGMCLADFPRGCQEYGEKSADMDAVSCHLRGQAGLDCTLGIDTSDKP